MTKTYAANYKNPDKLPHVILAKRIFERDPGNAPFVNDRINFIYYYDMIKNNQETKTIMSNMVQDPIYI